MPTTPRRRRIRTVALAALAVVIAVAGVLGTGAATPAQAVDSPGSTSIRLSQTFYAYVEAGESLTTSFQALGTANSHAVTIRTTAPDGTVSTCAVAVAAPLFTTCTQSALTSSQTGVWSVQFDRPTATSGANPSRFDWSILVEDGGTAVTGRVWSDFYRMYNTSTSNFSLWYVGPAGGVYRADYGGYIGIDSDFRSNQFGTVFNGTCRSGYRSFDIGGPYATGVYGNSPQACGAFFHIFFEAPSADLPPSATLPDGTSKFVLPPVTTPTLSNLAYTPASSSTRAGTITFDAASFVGNAQILVDADGDGSFTGPADRTIPIAVSAPGARSVTFDGLDGQGAPIAPTTRFGLRVAISQANEIHFVNNDVEQRASFTVTSVRGTNVGSTLLYWNDTGLRVAQRICPTPVLDGTAGFASAGGVHGWDCTGYTLAEMNQNDGITGSWGDYRYIDDWTFAPVNVAADLVVAASDSNYTVTKSVDAASTQAGDTVRYTISVAQIGNAPATASLSDDLAGVLDDAVYNGDVSATTGTATVAGQQLDWSGTLQVGQTATVGYSVTVADAASLAAAGDYGLANVATSAGCTTGCATSTPVGAYVLAKSADPAAGTTVRTGDVIRYTVVASQVGQGAVSGATFSDDLAAVIDDATWNDDATASTGALTRVGDTLRWTGDLPVGASATITYSVTVAGGGDGVLRNAVTTTSDAGTCVAAGACATAHTVAPVAPAPAPADPPADAPDAGPAGALPVTGMDAGATVALGLAAVAALIVGAGSILLARRRSVRRG